MTFAHMTRTCHCLPIRVAFLALCALGLIAVSGCSPDEPIRQYSVPKEASQMGSGSQKQQMLAAIVPKDTPWAFKLMGQPEKVDQYTADFRQLVSSLSFADDGTPNWQLPEKWQEEEGANQFVYRSLRPPGESSLKVTVSQLKIPDTLNEPTEGNWREFVAMNVNRWRGQLNLGDQAWDEMTPDLEAIEKLSTPDRPAYFVTLIGEGTTGGSMGGMSMPGSTMPPGSPRPGSAPPRATAAKDLQVKLPEGWREVPPLNIMAMKSYEVDGADGKKAAVTFTAAGGDRVSNVERWNGQIRGAADQPAKALEEAIKLTVNDAPAEVFVLVGGGDDPQSIAAAKIDWSSQDSLFIKMMGPADIVKAQQDAFLTLVKELKW
ncbi:MAG: hypothetical protein IT423_12120 [Pirellulaceae bacterium]|nr:hypothetical protein [Pirellulaceae bacterium]